MTRSKTAAIGLIALLLVVTISAGTVVIAGHQTVLDGTYVANTLEEEGGYEFITAQVSEQIEPPEAEATGGGGELPVNQSAVLQDAITESYIAAQGSANIDRFYEYLHGNRESPGLRINTTPVKENVGESVEAEIREQEPHELLALAGSPAAGDGEVDAELVEGLDAGPDAYRETQAEFEATVRDRVVERFVDETFASSSNDQLLALVIEDYDPNAYSDAEKEQMVADREGEIRVALDERIRTERGDEVNATVDSQMDELRQSMTDAPADVPEEIAGPASDLQTAIVRALTGEIDHDTYRENAVAARDDLAVAAGELAVEGLSEMPAQVQLTDQMGQEQQQALETAATAVQWLDRLVVILPILAVVLVAGVWRLSRSARTTASVTGLALVLSGGPVFVAATLAGSVLEARLPDEPTVTLLLSVIDGFFASLQANALAVLGAGVVLLIAVLVKRYGVDEWTRERLG
jgi:hypothetical protein